MTDVKTIRAADFARQPRWFNWLNSAWKRSYFLGTRTKLEKDRLIRSARKATGLSDFGPGNWEEPLDMLLESVNGEARLHAIGRFITRERLVNLLCVRLRAESYFKQHPEILEQDLYPASVIIGLQRTGTTKLQRLLAADPDTRALMSWEALNPAPLKPDDLDGHRRIKAARISEKALKIMSPGFFAIHPVEHLAPEEDVLLLDTSFMSTTAEATMHVPAYADWLERTDQSDAYSYMVRLLKLLQWQRPGKRWVLKTPHHLEFPNLVNKHFNEVQFIWTHRNVYESIPSFLSMVSYSRRLFSDAVTPELVTGHWMRKTGYMLGKALAFYRDGNDGMFTNVFYKSLIDDDVAEIERIYAARGAAVPDSLKRVFAESGERNPKGKYGAHKYSLDDFGLDHVSLEAATVEYRRFQQELGGPI